MRIEKEWIVDGCHLCVVTFCTPLRSSFVSVVFDFNASLNDVSPVSPKQLPVVLMRIEKCRLLMDVICVLFLLCLPPRKSSVSVVFDFNASLNDVAPLSPILLPVDYLRME